MKTNDNLVADAVAHLNVFTTGVAVNAIYSPCIRHYAGNPFIEAMPPLLERPEAIEAMRVLPDIRPEDRQASAMEREHMASFITAIRTPTGLHAESYSRLSRLIRESYLARNPLEPFFQANIDLREAALTYSVDGKDIVIREAYPLAKQAIPTANGMAILGLTGLGKSKLIEMNLKLLPQLVIHETYGGKPFALTQIVWMKFDAPPDGSILSLIVRFLYVLDALHERIGVKTSYVETYLKTRPSIQKAVAWMARLAAQHGLGALVLDEVQDMSPAGSRALLSFLVQLVNTVGIPVILVGGVDAMPLLNAQFRQARRSSAGDLLLRPAERGTHLTRFCKSLEEYQVTAQPVELTPAHIEALFDVSQGITDYMVRAFSLAQVRAIASGKERLTPGLIRGIGEDHFMQAMEVLQAMREGRTLVLRKRGDVLFDDNVPTISILPADITPPTKPAPTSPTIEVDEQPETGAASEADFGEESAEEAPFEPEVVKIDYGRTLKDRAQSARSQGQPVLEMLVRNGFRRSHWPKLLGMSPARP